MTIKAIETRYAGCRFRSRLEARWAVFFDTLGIEWEYEPEGFELPSGRYLPDFWLPGAGAWVEVKGGPIARRDALKVIELGWAVSAESQKVRLLQGDIPRRVSRITPSFTIPADCIGVRVSNTSFEEISRHPGYAMPGPFLSDGEHRVHLFRVSENGSLSSGDVERLQGLKSELFGQTVEILHPGMSLLTGDPIGPPGLEIRAPLPGYLTVGPDGRPEERTIREYRTVPVDDWELQRTIWIPGFTENEINGALDAARSARFEFGERGR